MIKYIHKLNKLTNGEAGACVRAQKQRDFLCRYVCAADVSDARNVAIHNKLAFLLAQIAPQNASLGMDAVVQLYVRRCTCTHHIKEDGYIDLPSKNEN